MDNRYQRFLLGATLGLAASFSFAQAPVDVIDPQVERREITTPAIDTEDFEVGVFVGGLSIQDFATEPVYGVRGAWHLSERFFFEANIGMASADLTSYEKISGGAPLFDDSERDYTFYNTLVGWNVLPGEIYFSPQRAFKSDLYLVGGVGGTDFLGDTWFTAVFGVGYRLLFNDWISLRLDVRDHLYDRDSLGEDETTNNIEWTAGVTFFF